MDDILKLWEQDDVLKEYAVEYQNRLPSFEEASSTLLFFTVFALGCRKLKLDTLADTYNKRVELYYTGVKKIGYINNTNRRLLTYVNYHLKL